MHVQSAVAVAVEMTSRGLAETVMVSLHLDTASLAGDPARPLTRGGGPTVAILGVAACRFPDCAGGRGCSRSDEVIRWAAGKRGHSETWVSTREPRAGIDSAVSESRAHTSHPTPWVIAHRARSSAFLPENAASGAVAALDAGCDGIEIDVRRTRDGRLVLMHDATPLRTTTGDLDIRRRRVEASSLADLRRLRLRGADPDMGVATLEDVLPIVLDRGAVVIVDVKDTRSVPGIWDDLLTVLRRLPPRWREQTIVQSRDEDELRRLRTALPSIGSSLICWRTPRVTARDPAAPAVLSRPWWAATRRSLAEDHAHGQRVLVWTVNEADQMDRLLDRGVDGIITDEPHLLLDLLARSATASRSGARPRGGAVSHRR